MADTIVYPGQVFEVLGTYADNPGEDEDIFLLQALTGRPDPSSEDPLVTPNQPLSQVDNIDIVDGKDNKGFVRLGSGAILVRAAYLDLRNISPDDVSETGQVAFYGWWRIPRRGAVSNPQDKGARLTAGASYDNTWFANKKLRLDTRQRDGSGLGSDIAVVHHTDFDYAQHTGSTFVYLKQNLEPGTKTDVANGRPMYYNAGNNRGYYVHQKYLEIVATSVRQRGRGRRRTSARRHH